MMVLNAIRSNFLNVPTANHRNGRSQKASTPQTPQERKAALVALRSRWADVQNKHLARHGHESRVDHRSLKEQGINRTPEIHFGPVHAANLNEGQIAAIQEHRAATRQQERTERRPAPERQQELEQKQKQKSRLFVDLQSYWLSTARL